eukprot:scaffold4879_cov354-Prasinococcus_capsulatus_cf.AAC.3
MKERMERTMQTALVLLPLDQTCTRFWVTSQELYEYNAGRLTFRKDRTVDCTPPTFCATTTTTTTAAAAADDDGDDDGDGDAAQRTSVGGRRRRGVRCG